MVCEFCDIIRLKGCLGFDRDACPFRNHAMGFDASDGAQYAVLKAISRQPGSEQVELTSAAIATKATLAEILTRLEARKLVRREAEESDKRRRYVYLTKAGEIEFLKAQEIVTEVDRSFLGRLPARKREEFTDMLLLILGDEL